jgi:hypothetical protein
MLRVISPRWMIYRYIQESNATHNVLPHIAKHHPLRYTKSTDIPLCYLTLWVIDIKNT